MRTDEGQAWYRSFSRKWPAADNDESQLGLKTHAIAMEQSKEWLKQSCKTKRATFVTDHGYRASMLHSLQYLDVINDHVFDLFHLILEGIVVVSSMNDEFVQYPSSRVHVHRFMCRSLQALVQGDDQARVLYQDLF